MCAGRERRSLDTGQAVVVRAVEDARRRSGRRRDRKGETRAEDSGAQHSPSVSRAQAVLTRDGRAPEGARSPSRSSSGPGRGVPTTSTSRKRASVSSHRTRSCISARRLPMQKWTPSPKARCCRAFARSMRNSFGALEDGLVAVGGHVPHDDLVALRDLLAGELRVPRRGAAHVRERRLPADDLAHHVRDETRVVAQLLVLVRVLVQRERRRPRSSSASCRCRRRSAGSGSRGTPRVEAARRLARSRAP